MLKRIITALLAFIVFIPVLVFSGTIVLPIALAIVIVVSLYEIAKCMNMHKAYALTIPLYLFGAGTVFLVYRQGLLDTTDRFVTIAKVGFIFAIVYMIYMFAVVIWSNGKLKFNDACTMCLMSLYIVISVSMIVYLRALERGEFIYLLVFIGAWSTDIFAYFTGMLIGKHKLIESISPKKTIEGSIGGIVFCSLFFVALGIVGNSFFGTNANLIFLAICGVFISMISKIGDLVMSAIKRTYGIKDFGTIFPGHGGMLDRFDSILAVALGVAAMYMIGHVLGIPVM